MSTAIRYYSRSGNTRALAEAISRATGVPAVSVDREGAYLAEPVDVLLIGGALHAYGLDRHLSSYLETLDSKLVKKAVVFSSSWLSKHSITLIKKGLEARGIQVEAEYFYARNKPGDAQLKACEAFAERHV